ncbi:D-amino-acid transaminase [Paracoccus benzoatiresistens]|uniref:Probable branched-chain-amino-acid aminotransferase n=1 Tax=Paracoccus benzoatiresistens TaxID=2997341 RepID=A0ABT4JAH6_9RHOB|nr:D-amino-acid transaminase [Paracoccus sp. EF6]MCZ0963924.1 D-amino-acid transaminase [Paracoccus sp. EF6]
MSRTVYINGEFFPASDARISVFDRGFLFGDSIYEVTAVIDGKMIDNDLHLGRLERSVDQLDIPMPLSRGKIISVQLELITRNKIVEGLVYLQVTRGTEDRSFDYSSALKPNLVAFTQDKPIKGTNAHRAGVKVAIVEDARWARRDIKTTMLLAQVQAKRHAKAVGCDEAWMVQDGFVTEGASSSAFILTRRNYLVTRPNSAAILPGCTRQAVIEVARQLDFDIEERLFTTEEACAAKEAFLTSATSLVTPVIEIAGHSIGAGQPGPVTRRIQDVYFDIARHF